jgi:hypothetical protein
MLAACCVSFGKYLPERARSLSKTLQQSALASVGWSEAKKLASDNGYQLTTDPVPTKRRLGATATKSGKPYEIDLHRDGKIVKHTPFGRLRPTP